MDILNQLANQYRNLFSGGAAKALFTLVSAFYFAFMASVIGITYLVYQGLDRAGIIKKFNDTLSMGMRDIERIASECSSKLLDLKSFFDCL